MSAYSGPQAAGAERARREQKRQEAQDWNTKTPVERRRSSRGKGCPSGKTILLTEKDAQTELVGTLVRKNRGNNRRKECRWYHCPLCGYYHLTSKPLDPTKKEH